MTYWKKFDYWTALLGGQCASHTECRGGFRGHAAAFERNNDLATVPKCLRLIADVLKRPDPSL
jgi:hypothetical protein